MSESENNAIDEIAYIKKIMSDSKSLVIDSGLDFIIWGIIIVIGLLYTYFQIIFKWTFDNDLVWMIIIIAGWTYSISHAIRKRKTSKASTFARKILGGLWGSCGIAMTIIGCAGLFSTAYSAAFISPLISVVLGIAFYVSGIVQRLRWVTLLAIGWWVGALYMFFFPNVNILLVMACMMILLQALPGFILYRKYKIESMKS